MERVKPAFCEFSKRTNVFLGQKHQGTLGGHICELKQENSYTKVLLTETVKR